MVVVIGSASYVEADCCVPEYSANGVDGVYSVVYGVGVSGGGGGPPAVPSVGDWAESISLYSPLAESVVRSVYSAAYAVGAWYSSGDTGGACGNSSGYEVTEYASGAG